MHYTFAALAQAITPREEFYMQRGEIKDIFGATIAILLLVWGLSLFYSAIRRMQQNSMQKHLLQKFSSAHDFAEFLQTPAGQNYVSSFSEAMTDPRISILNSLRVGIILVFFGIGCFTGGDGAVRIAGNVILFLGLGFIVSAGVAYRLSKNIIKDKND